MADTNPNTHTEAIAKTKRTGCKHELCLGSECINWKWVTVPAKSEELIRSESRRADSKIKATKALKEADHVKTAAIEKIEEDFKKYKENNQPEGYCGLSR